MTQLPEKFLEKLHEFLPSKKEEDVLKSFSNNPTVTFRTNTLKTSADILVDLLKKQGFILETVPFLTSAFFLKNKSLRELTSTNEYQEGLFYVQNISSMVPAIILNPKPGETVLDLAAAPGSKTTQMAAMMQNAGKIIANDSSRARFYRLLNNLKQQGITNTTVEIGDGKNLWKKYPEHFDKVLLDAPCSMEGRFNTNDPKSFADWTPGKVRKLALLQGYLLRSAISATKVGGTIVYSTCTISPEENEGVIDWILKKVEDVVEVEPITIKNLLLEKGIPRWHKDYNEKVADTARIYPSEIMEGFFIAKLKKVRSSFPSVVE